MECDHENYVSSGFTHCQAVVLRDREKGNAHRTVAIGSKRSVLKAATNALLLVTESEIAIYAVRMKESEKHVVELFLCSTIPATAPPRHLCLTDTHLFYIHEAKLRSCSLRSLIHREPVIQTVGMCQCSLPCDEWISLEAYQLTQGVLLDAKGEIYSFVLSPDRHVASLTVHPQNLTKQIAAVHCLPIQPSAAGINHLELLFCAGAAVCVGGAVVMDVDDCFHVLSFSPKGHAHLLQTLMITETVRAFCCLRPRALLVQFDKRLELLTL